MKWDTLVFMRRHSDASVGYYNENAWACAKWQETHETVLLDCTTGEAGNAIQ